MDLYIVRHGESLGNTGESNSVDPELSALGHVQALCLAERMKAIHLDAVISSPLTRALQTAVETAKIKNMKILLLPLLMEVGTEAGYEGPEIQKLKNIYSNIEMYSDGKPFLLSLLAEKKEQAYLRAKEVIERIRLSFPQDASVILFAHGTFNNYLINAAIGFDVRNDFNFCQENTGLTCIRFIKDNGQDKVKGEFINDYSHLNAINSKK